VPGVSIQLAISLSERRPGEPSLQTAHDENKTKFIQTPRVVAYYSQAAHNSIGIRANVVKVFYEILRFSRKKEGVSYVCTVTEGNLSDKGIESQV
jgi:hypothetical protein